MVQVYKTKILQVLHCLLHKIKKKRTKKILWKLCNFLSRSTFIYAWYKRESIIIFLRKKCAPRSSTNLSIWNISFSGESNEIPTNRAEETYQTLFYASPVNWNHTAYAMRKQILRLWKVQTVSGLLYSYSGLNSRPTLEADRKRSEAKAFPIWNSEKCSSSGYLPAFPIVHARQ